MTATTRKTKLSLEKQEAMRSCIPVPSNSSTGSNNEEDLHRDSSCYYPDCKKDANCTCKMCLDSIYATIDLMPISIHTSRPKPNNLDCTPISFDPSLLSTSTSTSTASHIPFAPAIKPSVRKALNKKIKKHKKGQNGYFSAGKFLILGLGLSLGLGFLLPADIVFPWVASGIFQPALSPDVVKRVGEKCWDLQSLNGKLRFLQKDLTSIVDGKVSNCILSDSTWKISQDGVLLNSRCILYKSAIEEVSIWGWPLQTAGLLTNGFSYRSFTILSGRVTQWNSGQVGHVIRKANTSWVQPKWGASVVQLDPNTWVLEYQRSSIVNGTSFYSSALEFLHYRIPRILGRVKKGFWRFAAFEVNRCNRFTANNGIKTPT